MEEEEETSRGGAGRGGAEQSSHSKMGSVASQDETNQAAPTLRCFRVRKVLLLPLSSQSQILWALFNISKKTTFFSADALFSFVWNYIPL